MKQQKFFEKLPKSVIALSLTLSLIFSGPNFVVLADEVSSPAPSASPSTTASADPSPSSTPSSNPSPSSSPTASTSPSPAVAPTDPTNSNTGSTSNNTATLTNNQTSNTTSNNNATSNSNTTASASSGSNTSSANTGNATVNTNDSSTQASTNTTVNTNQVENMPWTTWTGDGDWTTRSANTQTGSSSNNTANLTSNQTDSVTNNNTANLNNNMGTSSSTGANIANDNTGNAAITTGNASTQSSIQNVANLNTTSPWVGNGDWTSLWNGEAANFLTGRSSDNAAAANFNKVIQVLNQNGVDVNNLLSSAAVSGTNVASQNTGNANVQTGNSSVLATLFNLANSNIFGTNAVNVLYQDLYGKFSGDVNLANATPISLQNLVNHPTTISSPGSSGSASNQNTGSSSTNNSAVNGFLTLDVLNQNQGSLQNNLNLASLTGGNSANDNTGNASVKTGNADIIANLINFLNSNIFTPSFYLGVVNVYGTWDGNLILPQFSPPTAQAVSHSLGNTSNTQTGSTSANNSTTNQNSTSNLTNNNNGNILDNFNLNANSGGNLANDNTLAGKIHTGQSSGRANEANFVNANVVSNDPWWIILVNDLGKWKPELVSPHLANGAQIVLNLNSLDLSNHPSTNIIQPPSSASSSNASNTQTGSTSTNNSTTNQTTTANVTNNNNSSIINNVLAQSLSGDNSAQRNTGNADITTGDASILVNALNFLNANFSTPSFMLAIVNVFGSWTGDVLNFGQSVPTHNDPQGGTTPTANPSSTNTATNSDGNNSGSNNINSASGGNTNIASNTPVTNIIDNHNPSLASNLISGSGTVLGNSTQVLSFQEQDNNFKKGSASQNPAGQTALLKPQQVWMLILAVLVIIALASYWQRAKILKLIKRETP